MTLGTNKYHQVKSQYSNLKESFEKKAHTVLASAALHKPCVFLSHKSQDKASVIEIGKYITSQGIDVYIDIEDDNLQKAVKNDDHASITAAIEIGIENSTHLLAYITEKTKDTPWVPYEVGYAKSKGRSIAAIKAKSTTLPSFLHIVKNIKNITELNTYLKDIPNQKTMTEIFREQTGEATSTIKLANATHPLSPYIEAL